MTRRMTTQLTGLALIAASGLLVLSVAGCYIVPKPLPGQPIVSDDQEAEARLTAQNDAHERRELDHPCIHGGCRHTKRR